MCLLKDKIECNKITKTLLIIKTIIIIIHSNNKNFSNNKNNSNTKIKNKNKLTKTHINQTKFINFMPRCVTVKTGAIIEDILVPTTVSWEWSWYWIDVILMSLEIYREVQHCWWTLLVLWAIGSKIVVNIKG